jgi:hypothetical protein
MDDLFAHLFSGPELPSDAPISQRPEIQDAILRTLIRKGIFTRYDVSIATPVPTTNPHVQRLVITIAYKEGLVVSSHPSIVWVDDFELVFRFAKWSASTNDASSGSEASPWL